MCASVVSSSCCFPFEKKKRDFLVLKTVAAAVAVVVVVLLNELISRNGHNGCKLPGWSSRSSSSKLVKSRPPFLDNNFKDHFLS